MKMETNNNDWKLVEQRFFAEKERLIDVASRVIKKHGLNINYINGQTNFDKTHYEEYHVTFQVDNRGTICLTARWDNETDRCHIRSSLIHGIFRRLHDQDVINTYLPPEMTEERTINFLTELINSFPTSQKPYWFYQKGRV
jgi:hypothetical protein